MKSRATSLAARPLPDPSPPDRIRARRLLVMVCPPAWALAAPATLPGAEAFPGLLPWGLLCAALLWLAVLLRRLRQARARLAEALVRQREASERLLREQESTAQARDGMARSEKLAAIGQLAAGVAHEINNPLAYVSSNLATLSEYVARLARLLDADGPGPRQAGRAADDRPRTARMREAPGVEQLCQELPQLIADTQDGVRRIHQIAANLKDFARPGQAAWEAVQLDDVVERTLTIVWNALKYKAEVRQELFAPPPVLGVPNELGQVLMNLLTNAVQALDKHGVISVRTGRGEGESWVEVEDNGRGMAPEVLARIFEPFYTTKAADQGTGLGLAISQAIVQRHQGRLEVESQPGKGSRFRLVLPVAASADSAGDVKQPQASAPHVRRQTAS